MSLFRKLVGDFGQIKLPLLPHDRQILAPKTVRNLQPVSIWCDEISYAIVCSEYNSLFAGEGTERVTHLNTVATQLGARCWQEIFPFIPSLFWCISWRVLSHDDAAAIPIIGLSFLYKSDLGMLATKKEDVVFFRIEPTRRCCIFSPSAPLGQPVDLRFAERQMSEHGWKRDIV